MKSEEGKMKSEITMRKLINTRRLRMITFLILHFSLFTLNLFAENEFSLRLAPAVESPLGLTQFNPGMGAAASLDWAFWPFAKNFNFGIRLGGAFTSVPAQAGDPLTLFEGKAGPFVRWQPFDRWAFDAGLGAGIYQYTRGQESETKAMFSFNIGAEFRVSPYFSLFADGAYSYRIFNPSQPLSSIGATLGIRLDITEIMTGKARVQIEKTEQYRVFPVSWAWYEQNPVAKVKVVNEEPNAITDVNLTFFMDSFMSQPWTFAVLPSLAPGESPDDCALQRSNDQPY